MGEAGGGDGSGGMSHLKRCQKFENQPASRRVDRPPRPDTGPSGAAGSTCRATSNEVYGQRCMHGSGGNEACEVAKVWGTGSWGGGAAHGSGAWPIAPWWTLGPPVARSQVRQPPEDGTPGTSELKHVISSKAGAEDGWWEGGCLGHERRRGHAGGGVADISKTVWVVAAFCTAMMLEEATHGTPRPQQTPTAPCKQTGGFLLGSNANRILQFRVHSHGKHT